MVALPKSATSLGKVNTLPQKVSHSLRHLWCRQMGGHSIGYGQSSVAADSAPRCIGKSRRKGLQRVLSLVTKFGNHSEVMLINANGHHLL